LDSEVDRRLEQLAHPKRSCFAAAAGVAQARLAYQLFSDQFADDRWIELTDTVHTYNDLYGLRRRQRTRQYADTLYIENLIGPRQGEQPFLRPYYRLRGTTAPVAPHHRPRTSPTRAEVREGLARVGVDMEDVGLALEKQGVASFRESFLHVLETLTTKAQQARGEADMDWAVGRCSDLSLRVSSLRS